MPNDGWYYVILKDEIKGKFKGKDGALGLYRSLLSDTGYSPPSPERATGKDIVVEVFMDDLERYWSESHKFRRRGGKGKY